MQSPQQQLPLKDIHLPDSVSWWPLATGYWLILLLIIISILSIVLIRKYLKNQRIKKLALKEYQQIKNEYQQSQNQKQLVTSLSALLRRAAISSYPRKDCASLTGKDWLKWLDTGLPESGNSFSTGPGYLLTDFAYSKSDHSDDINNLLTLSLAWLKKLPAVTSTKGHNA